MIIIACSGKDKAITRSICEACFNTNHSGIASKQCVGIIPCIAMMLCRTWDSVMLGLDDLCKEWDGHSIASKLYKISGSRIVLIIVIQGQSIGVAVMSLEEM